MENNSTNKQSIIGFILIGLVFFGYMLYNNYQMEKYNEQLAVEQLAESVAAEASAAVAEQQGEQKADVVAVTEPLVVADPFIIDGAEQREVVLENDYLTLTLSTVGGQITDATLKQHTKYAPKEERNELVKLFDPTSASFDMSFYVKDGLKNVKVVTAEHNFVCQGVVEGADSQSVTFTLPFKGGAALNFVYTLYNSKSEERDYLVGLDVQFSALAPLMANQTSIGVDWRTRSYQNERSYKNENMYTSLYYRHPGETGIEDLGVSEGNKSKNVSTSVDWVAFKQQYFTSAIIPQSVDFTYADVAYQTMPEKSGYIKEYSMAAAVPYTPQTDGYKFDFYLGPNKFPVLKKLTDANGDSLNLERVIPLGWIFSTYVSRWVVIPLFTFLSKYIESFGLIILILTLLVKLIISPLTYKSYLSTAKMRAVRPELEAINAKYPRQEDAMKKQQATMELYNKAGISPMSGCLPMLIQMPILIAMFRFFPASIELRGKSFLWSDDLSSYDSILDLPFNIPFYGDHISLFCLLMVVVLFGYSYMNYKQTAATQPQMPGMKFMTVYMMPIMMLFWFNDYSSGLCYYYLLSNIITMLMMLGIRALVDDDKVRASIHTKMANTKGKKSRFQQRYEELMRQQEQLNKQQR
ncbi:MAG: membrane protein insertase YidC [Alistipes sp.]|nr:membrane protein insertase YidC [Alistipes sp.]MBQ9963012.1 membrane protein insertase YidC [Alistipes sp.]